MECAHETTTGGTDFTRIAPGSGRNVREPNAYLSSSLHASEIGPLLPRLCCRLCVYLLCYTVIMRLRYLLAAFTLMAVLVFAQEVPRPAGELAISMNSGSQVLL